MRKLFGEGNISFVEKKKNGEGTGLMDGGLDRNQMLYKRYCGPKNDNLAPHNLAPDNLGPRVKNGRFGTNSQNGRLGTKS